MQIICRSSCYICLKFESGRRYSLMSYKIVALPGDGIEPEILNGSLEILSQLSSDFNFNYEIETHDFGAIAIDNHGTPLPDTTLNACKQADAILLGAVGGPK